MRILCSIVSTEFTVPNVLLCKEKKLISCVWGTLGKSQRPIHIRKDTYLNKTVSVRHMKTPSMHSLWKAVLVSLTPPRFPLVHSNLTPLKFSWPFLTTLSWLFHFMSLYKVDEQFSLYLWQLFLYSHPCGFEQHLSLDKKAFNWII